MGLNESYSNSWFGHDSKYHANPEKGLLQSSCDGGGSVAEWFRVMVL